VIRGGRRHTAAVILRKSQADECTISDTLEQPAIDSAARGQRRQSRAKEASAGGTVSRRHE